MIAAYVAFHHLLADEQRVVGREHRGRGHPLGQVGEDLQHLVTEGEIEVVERGLGLRGNAVGVEDAVDVLRESQGSTDYSHRVAVHSHRVAVESH
jgi:hypothetical protein